MDLDNSNIFGYREWQEPVKNIELKDNIRYKASEEGKEENIENLKIDLIWNDEECKYKINMYSYVDIGRNDVFDLLINRLELEK